MVPNAYRLVTSTVHRIPLPFASTKLADSLTGRRAAASRWVDWASTERTTAPLVWVHGASVGEGLTAVPVMLRLRTAMSGLQIIHTFSSPSAASWPGNFGADRADYVPLDAPNDVSRTLDALQPSLLVFSRGDIWPELTARAHRAGVPIAVLGATVRPASDRLRWPVRSLLRQLHRTVAWLGAVTELDASRWKRLGVRPEAIAVTGDPRHDQIVERVSRIDTVGPVLQWARGRTVLVAGSTEPRDEEVLLDALSQLAPPHHRPGLLLVPHDPTPRRLAAVSQLAKSRCMNPSIWRGGTLGSATDCIVAAVVGSLADIYLAGDIAYVGGGFRKGRLHSVVEPASYALPVLFGPDWEDSSDAAAMVKSGGGIPLPRRQAHCAMAQLLSSSLGERGNRDRVGWRARATLAQGAAQRTAADLLSLMAERA